MEKTVIIRELIDKLSYGLYEKRQTVALSLLAAVAGESIFLLGPPGVAKSMVARRLKEAFRNARSFEYLMSRFSTPDELFGPVSISRLKDHDRYERITEGYLPEATVVFLDEIWKAGASIQNTLLTVLNEKIYRNGAHTVRLPMKLLMAASNELPAEQEGLEALWDRFLIRYVVDGIRDKDSFVRMICDSDDGFEGIEDSLKISDELYQSWQDGWKRIEVKPQITDFIFSVRNVLEGDRTTAVDRRMLKVPYISDRRWKKVVRLLRASAFLCGRSEVGWTDLTLLLHCLWNDPDDKETLKKLMAGRMAEAMADGLALELTGDRLLAFRQELDSCAGSSGMSADYKVIQSFYYQLLTRDKSKRILIYINEFKQLIVDGETVPFILITDRYKTGAQILKRYEKEKHPHVFPKDLLAVGRVREGVRINGTLYPIVEEKQTGRQPESVVAKPSDSLPQILDERISEELNAKKERFDTLRATIRKEMDGHPFLDEEQRDLLENVFSQVETRIYTLQQTFNELSHAWNTLRR